MRESVMFHYTNSLIGSEERKKRKEGKKEKRRKGEKEKCEKGYRVAEKTT